MPTKVRVRVSSATVDKADLISLRKTIEACSDESFSYKGRTYERRLHFPTKRKRLGKLQKKHRRSAGRFHPLIKLTHDIVRVVLSIDGNKLIDAMVVAVVPAILRWATEHRKERKGKIEICLYGPDNKILRTIEK